MPHSGLYHKQEVTQSEQQGEVILHPAHRAPHCPAIQKERRADGRTESEKEGVGGCEPKLGINLSFPGLESKVFPPQTLQISKGGNRARIFPKHLLQKKTGYF